MQSKFCTIRTQPKPEVSKKEGLSPLKIGKLEARTSLFQTVTDSSRGLKCKTFCKMCSCKKSAKNLQKFCRFFCKFFAILLQFFCNCFANFLQNWFGIRIKGSHFRVNILLRGTTNPKIRGRTLTQVLHQNTQDFPISISQTPSVLMNVTKKVVPYILH